MLTKKKCVRQLLCEHTKCMSGWRPAGLTRGSQRRGLCPRPVPGAGAGRDVPRDGGGGAACGAAADPPAGPLGAAPSPSPAGTASAGALPFSRSESPPLWGLPCSPQAAVRHTRHACITLSQPTPIPIWCGMVTPVTPPPSTGPGAAAARHRGPGQGGPVPGRLRAHRRGRRPLPHGGVPELHPAAPFRLGLGLRRCARC